MEIRDEDFEAIYAAVKYFNEMGDNSSINHSSDLLEEAQKILERYLTDTKFRKSSQL